MAREYAKVKYSGRIDFGPRTCHWQATALVSRAPEPQVWCILDGPPHAVKFVELDDLDLRIEVLNEGLTERYGEYSGSEVPEPEVRYWTAYVERLCAVKIERGEGLDDVNWEREEI